MIFFRFSPTTGEIEIVPSKKQLGKRAERSVFKGQITKEIALTLDTPTVEVDKTLSTFFAAMTRYLKAGHPVVISGFGKFKPRKCRRGKSRDPRNGTVVTPTGRRSVTFRPSSRLKAQLM